jgi:mobilization protein NikA
MTRPRNSHIKVFLTPDERADIAALAESAHLSLSAYLRAAGLNQQIRSVLDIQAVAELAKVNGDLGRLGGLLKQWLSEQRGLGARPREVEKLMYECRKLQEQSHEIMGRITR